MSSVFKKDESLDKENDGPVGMPSLMSKVAERIFYKQINNFVTSKLSSFISQYSLLKMMVI